MGHLLFCARPKHTQHKNCGYTSPKRRAVAPAGFLLPVPVAAAVGNRFFPPLQMPPSPKRF